MSVVLSILIPCLNEEAYLPTCLESILESEFDHSKLEILVIDGGSTDASMKILKAFQQKYAFIQLHQNPHRFTPHALNIGIAAAKGEFVMIASAHSSFSSNYIPLLLDKMAALNADVVGGLMQTKVLHSSPKTEAIKAVLSHPFGVGNALFRTGVKQDTQVDTVPFGIYRRKLLVEVGGYNSHLLRNQDIELSKRLLAHGAKIFLIPEASCTYFARERFSALAKNSFANGKWNLFTLRITKNMNALSLRHLVPLSFVISLVLPLIFSFLYIPIAGISILSASLYLGFIFFVSLKINGNFFYHAMAFICLHLSYGFGSLYGLFANLPSKTNETT